MSVSISQLVDEFKRQYGNSAAFTRLPQAENTMTQNQVLRTLSRQYRNFYGLPGEATDSMILRLVGHGYDFAELLRTIFRVRYGMQADVGAIDGFLRSHISFALFQRRHQPENILEEQYAHQFVEGEDRRQYLIGEINAQVQPPGGLSEGGGPVFVSRTTFRQGAERAPVPGIGANVNAGQDVDRLIHEPPPPSQAADREAAIRSQHQLELKDEDAVRGPRLTQGEAQDAYDREVQSKAYVASRDRPRNEGLGVGPQFGEDEDSGELERKDNNRQATRDIEADIPAPGLIEHVVSPLLRHVVHGQPIIHRLGIQLARPLIEHVLVKHPGAPLAPGRRAPVPGYRPNLYDVPGVAIGGAGLAIDYIGNYLFGDDEFEKKDNRGPHYPPSPAPPPSYPPSTPPTPPPHRPPRGQGEPMENPYDRTPPTLPFGYAYYPQPFRHAPRIDRGYVGNYHLPVVGRHDFVKWTKYTENNALASSY